MHEPRTDLNYSDNPNQEHGWYSWDGKIVGAGKITHQRFVDEERIDQLIEFTRPFKSSSKVWWEFETIDNEHTRVHWNMQGEMPFLFRFMAKKMPEYISKDYDTGLVKLRSELDQAAEKMVMSFDGKTTRPDTTALTIHFEGHLEEMKTAMSEGFPRLMQYIADNDIEPTGAPFSIYNKVDLKTMHFDCDMAVPVADGTQSKELVVKQIPGGEFFQSSLQGNYEFLELAWYQAYSHLQMSKIKPKHNNASLEVYENDPNTVSHTNEIRTSILIPV